MISGRNLFKLCLFIAFVAAIVFLAGCVTDPDDAITLPPIDTSASPYDLKIVEAWVEFRAGNYGGSISVFREAADIDPLRKDAYLGLGWCYAVTDQMEDAIYNFNVAIVKQSDSPDGHASVAFVYLAQNRYEDAIPAAERAISLGGEEYVFEWILEVRTRNLRLLLAECYYALGKYADSQLQIDILEPGNELDENSRTYKKDLLLEIEKLRSSGPVLSELRIADQ
jgi:tetratricopeptide (TPR) repeat protein